MLKVIALTHTSVDPISSRIGFLPEGKGATIYLGSESGALGTIAENVNKALDLLEERGFELSTVEVVNLEGNLGRPSHPVDATTAHEVLEALVRRCRSLKKLAVFSGDLENIQVYKDVFDHKKRSDSEDLKNTDLVLTIYQKGSPFPFREVFPVSRRRHRPALSSSASRDRLSACSDPAASGGGVAPSSATTGLSVLSEGGRTPPSSSVGSPRRAPPVKEDSPSKEGVLQAS